MKQNSRETDIDIDELLLEELIDNNNKLNNNNKKVLGSRVDNNNSNNIDINQQKKKEVQVLKRQLNELLNVPLQNIEKFNQQSKKRVRTITRGGSNTNNAIDTKTWKKRSSFFVYTPANS